MKMFRKIIPVLIVIVIMVTFSACGKDNNKLVMATNAAFPPYEYYDNEAIVGIDVEIAKAIAEKLGKELVIEDMEFNSIIGAVQTGKADIGLAGMTVREDRLVSVNFSVPYTTASQVIIVREGSDIASPDDLADKSVGVQESTTGDIYVTDEMPDADCKKNGLKPQSRPLRQDMNRLFL
jgi:ABC-type amino acid transport substrate-binding protein